MRGVSGEQTLSILTMNNSCRSPASAGAGERQLLFSAESGPADPWREDRRMTEDGARSFKKAGDVTLMISYYAANLFKRQGRPRTPSPRTGKVDPSSARRRMRFPSLSCGSGWHGRRWNVPAKKGGAPRDGEGTSSDGFAATFPVRGEGITGCRPLF